MPGCCHKVGSDHAWSGKPPMPKILTAGPGWTCTGKIVTFHASIIMLSETLGLRLKSRSTQMP